MLSTLLPISIFFSLFLRPQDRNEEQISNYYWALHFLDVLNVMHRKSLLVNQQPRGCQHHSQSASLNFLDFSWLSSWGLTYCWSKRPFAQWYHVAGQNTLPVHSWIKLYVNIQVNWSPERLQNKAWGVRCTFRKGSFTTLAQNSTDSMRVRVCVTWEWCCCY